MRITKRLRRSLYAGFIALVCLFALVDKVSAQTLSDYTPGSYEIEAELSCYVNAMGGVEFGQPLLTSTVLTVEEDGTAWITLHLTKSSVTIYSVTCDTFVDASPSYVTDDRGVTSGTIGYYDADGNLVTEDAIYTLSEDTALNTASEEVHYVDSITFPMTFESDTYNLTMYINSNVMGVQFCNENDQAESTTYASTLTIYWDGAVDVIEEEVAEVEGEEMDGLTIYQAETDSEATEEATEEAVEETTTVEEISADEEEEAELMVHSFLFGDITMTAAIQYIVEGFLLIFLGLSLLVVRTDRKKRMLKEQEKNEE